MKTCGVVLTPCSALNASVSARVGNGRSSTAKPRRRSRSSAAVVPDGSLACTPAPIHTTAGPAAARAPGGAERVEAAAERFQWPLALGLLLLVAERLVALRGVREPRRAVVA